MKSILLYSLVIISTKADYYADRNAILEEEKFMSVGSSIILTPEEDAVNKKLLQAKSLEYKNFLPAKHFFQSRHLIEQSEVFKFIRDLPKGAMLHGHDSALVSLNFLHNLTYEDNLYICKKQGRLVFHFFETPNNACKWKLLSEARKVEGYEDYLLGQISLMKFDPYKDFRDINEVWKHFIDTFITVHGLLHYAPVFKKYLYQVLQEFYDDNVMYMEIRGTFSPLYDLNGQNIDAVDYYVDVFKDFQHKHPDFLGAKLIYAPLRKVTSTEVEAYIKHLKKVVAKYPEFIAGFDLVGQEDLGYPLKDFADQLKTIKNIPFFFHAAETNWFGSDVDENLYDAILLGTKRIGHGFGIAKHPYIAEIIKKKSIALEICPISNQVLKLVEDPRNHPAVEYIANDFPLIISCDDPTFWNATAMSYDWYMAFMGFGNRASDLRLLKQLAMNSLKYSALPDKEYAIAKWNEKWNQFIKQEYNGVDNVVGNKVLFVIIGIIYILT